MFNCRSVPPAMGTTLVEELFVGSGSGVALDTTAVLVILVRASAASPPRSRKERAPPSGRSPMG